VGVGLRFLQQQQLKLKFRWIRSAGLLAESKAGKRKKDDCEERKTKRKKENRECF